MTIVYFYILVIGKILVKCMYNLVVVFNIHKKHTKCTCQTFIKQHFEPVLLALIYIVGP